MKSLLITSLLIAMAAVCNAIMDTLEDHLYRSVFKNWPEWFTGENYKWKLYAKRMWWIPPITYDFWHCCKETMLAIFFYLASNTWLEFAIITVVWWAVFTPLYKFVLYNKE